MIQQIDGAGLTGIAGKSAKHGKGTLFAKLFAMLEKHADATAKSKGKGLQITAWQPSKGKTLAATGQQATLAVTGKGKHLPIIAGKAKHGETETDGIVATAVQSSEVIINNTNTRKHKAFATQTSGIHDAIARQMQQHSEAASGKQAVIAKQATEGKSQLAMSASTEQTETDAPELLAGQTDKQAKAAAKAEFAINTDTDKPVQQADKPIISAQQADKPIISAQQADKPIISAQQGKAEAILAKAETGKPQAAAQQSSPPITAGLQQEDHETEPASMKRNATATRSAFDIEHAKARSETSAQVAAAQNSGKQPQATLHSQNLQAQNSLAGNNVAAAGSATVQAAGSDASLADSGQQQHGDEGGRESRNLSGLSGDNKTGQSQQAQAGNFQSHLAGKSAASMTLFDTIDHIAHSVKNGKTRLEIQLEPAHLGKIQVTLQTDASKQLQVHMVVDQGATRSAIEQQLPALRNALAQQGFDLSGFSMGSGGSQQGQGTGHDNLGGSRNYAGSEEHSGFVVDTIQSSATQNTRSADGGLSIRV